MFAILVKEKGELNLPDELRSFVDVFKYKDIANLPRPEGAEHTIYLEPS